MKWIEIAQVAAIIFVAAAVLLQGINFIIDFWEGPSPRGIADSYCRANGYASSTNHKFTTDTFFVNCTQTVTETCSSNEECIHENGVMKE